MTDLELSLQLTPKIFNGSPEIQLTLDDYEIFRGELHSTKIFDINQEITEGSHVLALEFFNKKENDTNLDTGEDKAVLIDWISFFSIADDKFIWQGDYRPRYPEAWIKTNQELKKSLSEQLKNITYLGWNGTWELHFTSPVFVWIHQIKNLGWIYD